MWQLRLTSGRTPYVIDGIESAECPVSAITTESRWLLNLESGAKRVYDASGASMFGPDAGRFPAWWFDAVTTIEGCRVLENNARMEAETAEAERR